MDFLKNFWPAPKPQKPERFRQKYIQKYALIYDNCIEVLDEGDARIFKSIFTFDFAQDAELEKLNVERMNCRILAPITYIEEFFPKNLNFKEWNAHILRIRKRNDQWPIYIKTDTRGKLVFRIYINFNEEIPTETKFHFFMEGSVFEIPETLDLKFSGPPVGDKRKFFGWITVLLRPPLGMKALVS